MTQEGQAVDKSAALRASQLLREFTDVGVNILGELATHPPEPRELRKAQRRMKRKSSPISKNAMNATVRARSLRSRRRRTRTCSIPRIWI